MAIAAASAGSSRQVRIGLVLYEPLVGRATDPVEYSAYRGLLRAARDLHVQAKAVGPSPTDPSERAWFDYLGRQHYDLVMAFGFVPGLASAAYRFPDVKFASLDATRQELGFATRNVEGTEFHTEQAAYLAGFVAASMADQGPRPHVVSSVGGTPEPQVQAYIAGFQAGAKRADPKIKLLNAYTSDFRNRSKCAYAALDQIAHGSRVVFAVAGACGIGALEAAKRKGVYGVGVDTDQSYLGKFILTSAIQNLNAAVYDLAKLVVHRRLRTGGNLSFDLRNHGVGLGKFSPDVPLELRRRLVRLTAKIEQGKIVVPATLTRWH